MFANGGLGGRCKYWLGKFLGELQPFGQRQSTHGSGRTVVLPSGSDKVSAHDSLDGQRPEALDDDAASLETDPVFRIRQHVG